MRQKLAALALEEIDSDVEIALPEVEDEDDVVQVPPTFDLKTIELA